MTHQEKVQRDSGNTSSELPQVYLLVLEPRTLSELLLTRIHHLHSRVWSSPEDMWRPGHQRRLLRAPNLFKHVTYPTTWVSFLLYPNQRCPNRFVLRLVRVLSCWTAPPVSVGWPRSWQTRCLPVDGCGRCKRPR